MVHDEIKYKKEILEICSVLFPNNNLTDDELLNVFIYSLKEQNQTLDDFIKDIDVGIKNGYSVEFQISLLKRFICVKIKDKK
jgi:hypothetical protein